MCSWTKISCLVMMLAVALLPSLAFAQKPVLVHVIALDSDDASEDQADALTAALRSRIRSTPSWQMAESNQSLPTLLPALKCPARPDSACLQRIGDQLKTDRFFWGTVTKASIAHQVVAEVHLWTRGKPEQVAKETFSDNLKDQNDDALKRIALQLFERLTGQATQGTLIVHATGTQVGTVVVDGNPMAQLDHGQATLLLGSGPHVIDVRVEGMAANAQNIVVVVNTQNEVSFELKATGPVLPPDTKPSHPRKTIGFITVGIAGAAAIASGILIGLYAGDAGKFNDWRATISPSFDHPCTNQMQFNELSGQGVSNACIQRGHADTEGSLAWAFGTAAVGLAALGIVLIVTDHGEEKAATSGRIRVLPSFGPNGAGMSALLTF